MKKLLLSIALLAMVCGTADAQSFLEKMKERAKNAAEQNLGNKVEKGVNDVLDGNLGKKNKQQRPRKLLPPLPPGPARNAAKPAIPASSATNAVPRSRVEKLLLLQSLLLRNRLKALMQKRILYRETKSSLRIR